MSLDATFADLIGWMLGAMPYVFVVVLIAYLGLGLILDYHWGRYGVGLIQKFKFRLSYIVMGLILLGVMATTLTGING